MKSRFTAFFLALTLAAGVAGATACSIHRQPPPGTYTDAGLKAYNGDQFLKDLLALSQTAINLNAAAGAEHLSDANTRLVRDFSLSAAAEATAYAQGKSAAAQIRFTTAEFMSHIQVERAAHPTLAAILDIIVAEVNALPAQ